MKKFLSMMLALILVVSMSTITFAKGDETYTDMSTVTLTKEYKLTNSGTLSPAEIFSFTELTCTGVENAGVGVTKDNAPVPTIRKATFAAGAAGNGTAGTQTITITLPEYTAVGVYTYTFNEVDNKTAGVTYRAEPITLKVTVIEQDGKTRVAAVHTEAKDGAKSATFDNTYSAGSLNVTKNVTGIMGDKEKSFDVNVTFTAPEGKTVREAITYNVGTETKKIDANWTGSKNVKITLKHDQTITFTNIPYGVTYNVQEADYKSDGYDAATYVNEKGTISTSVVTTTITNNKGGFVDTGINMDSMPYILMLAVVCMGLFGFFFKKRMMRED